MSELLRNTESLVERKFKAVVALIRTAHILPTPFASHGNHFIHEDPEQLGYTAIREDEVDVYQPSLFDE